MWGAIYGLRGLTGSVVSASLSVTFCSPIISIYETRGCLRSRTSIHVHILFIQVISQFQRPYFVVRSGQSKTQSWGILSTFDVRVEELGWLPASALRVFREASALPA